MCICKHGFSGGSDGEESACDAGDLGLISGLGRSPGEANGNPPQISCLENSIDRGAWLATLDFFVYSLFSIFFPSMSNSKLREIVRDREAWHAAVPWGCKESDMT